VRTARVRLSCLFAFSSRFWGLAAFGTGGGGWNSAAGLGFSFAPRPLPSLSDRGWLVSYSFA